jgi:hypothetical protein
MGSLFASYSLAIMPFASIPRGCSPGPPYPLLAQVTLPVWPCRPQRTCTFARPLHLIVKLESSDRLVPGLGQTLYYYV